MYKRYWLVKINTNGFESKMLVHGTEQELWSYMESELGYIPGYCGATEQEVTAAKMLGIKAYLCPEVNVA